MGSTDQHCIQGGFNIHAIAAVEIALIDAYFFEIMT
jgi:L-alanine-DL-glutamate epimerase-like enolase superfamily enzyme